MIIIMKKEAIKSLEKLSDNRIFKSEFDLKRDEKRKLKKIRVL